MNRFTIHDHMPFNILPAPDDMISGHCIISLRKNLIKCRLLKRNFN